MQATFILNSASDYNQEEKLTTHFKNRNAFHLNLTSRSGSRNVLFLPLYRLRLRDFALSPTFPTPTCPVKPVSLHSVQYCLLSSQSQTLWYSKCIIFHSMQPGGLGAGSPFSLLGVLRHKAMCLCPLREKGLGDEGQQPYRAQARKSGSYHLP